LKTGHKKRGRPGGAFLISGVKRIFDSRALYAQVVVTEDCNLRCGYCNEYVHGAEAPPLCTLMARIDALDSLGVMVYDILGGEPLLHADLAPLIRHIKSKRRGGNIVTLITNGFLLTPETINSLNHAGLDMMQISVDSPYPTNYSRKSLKALRPKLDTLKKNARFSIKVQSVLTEETADRYPEFRRLMEGLPFDFGFSILHQEGGRAAITGEKYLRLLKEHKLFAGMNIYRRHASEVLMGDFSRPWKCLGGSKFLYVSAAGEIRFCSQNREYSMPLEEITLYDLKSNNRHKSCEPGCVLGCARLISHALGEPFKTLKTSLSLVARLRRDKKSAARRRGPVERVAKKVDNILKSEESRG